MKIIQMSIENFRVFYGKHTFSFEDKQLIIVRGQNGHGKSSFFDAIEWCLTGDIQRYVGSDERRKFQYIIHQSLVSQEAASDRIEPKASVELWLEKNDGEHVKIKRIFHFGKRIQKPVEINGLKYGVTIGSNKIIELLNLKSLNNEGEKELSSRDFSALLSSTQFLSQDQLQAFISARKPQERYEVIEKVLGIKKFGSEFREYIKSIRILIEKQQEEISKKITAQNQNLEVKFGIIKTRKDILSKVGSESEESIHNIIDKLITRIQAKESGLPILPSLPLSEDTQAVLLSYRKLLQERESKLVEIQEVLEKSEPILSIREKGYENKLVEIQIELAGLNKKVSKNELRRYKMENILLEVNQMKSYRLAYQDNILLQKELNIEIGKQKSAYDQIIMDSDLLEATKLFDGEKSFKGLYERKLDYFKVLNDYIEVMDKEKEIQLLYNDLTKVGWKIEEESKVYSRKIEVKNGLNERKMEIVKTVNTQKDDAIAQMIHSIQRQLLDKIDENIPCPVCGTQFEEPRSIHAAVEVKMDQINKMLDESEISLRQINTDLAMVDVEIEKSLEVTKNKINKKQSLISQIEREEVLVASNKAKIPLNIQELTNEKARLEKSMVNEFIDRYAGAYNLAKAAAIIEKEINRLHIREKECMKEKENLKNAAGQRVNLLQGEEGIIERRLQRINRYLLVLEKVEEQNTNQIDRLSKLKIEIESKKRTKEIKLIEIREFIPEFKAEDREEEIKKLIAHSNLLRNWDGELEKELTKIETYLSHNEVLILQKEYSMVELDLKEARDRRKYIEELLIQLNELDRNQGKIQSELMDEYLQRHSETIDNLFLQISPHAFFRHVHLVPKEGGLYIVVSDKKEIHLSELSKEELEKQFNASLTFSSAQSNVLAVCIFLALGLSQEWTPLQTIGIDDPFQNLDDVNVFSFLDVLSQVLLNKQVIISTHDDKFASLIRNKSSLENDQVAEIWLESYSKDSISIQSDSFVEIINKND